MQNEKQKYPIKIGIGRWGHPTVTIGDVVVPNVATATVFCQAGVTPYIDLRLDAMDGIEIDPVPDEKVVKCDSTNPRR